MHRKSAYILFLAVLGLLVIGIVMLFSTSAFARDSHGDVYFFIKRQAMWFGVGLVICIFAALVDYHLWQRGFGALLCPAHRHALKRIPPLDWLGPNYCSAFGIGKGGRDLFSRCLVCAI